MIVMKRIVCYFFTAVFLIAAMTGCTVSKLELSKLESGGQFSFPGLRPGASHQEAEEVLGFSLGNATEQTGPFPIYGKDNATLVCYFPKETPFTVLGQPVETNYTFLEDSLCNMTMTMEFDTGQSKEIEKMISILTESYGEPDIHYTEETPWGSGMMMTITDHRWIRQGEDYYTVLVCGVADLTKTSNPRYSVQLSLLYNEWTDVSELLSAYEEKLKRLEQ